MSSFHWMNRLIFPSNPHFVKTYTCVCAQTALKELQRQLYSGTNGRAHKLMESVTLDICLSHALLCVEVNKY